METFKRLVEKADVVVEDLPPGSMADMGLGYKTLKGIYPGLVMASITGFGQSGPYRDYKANSMISYAVTGLMYMNGEPGREPLTGSGHIPEYEAAVHAYNAIAAALFWREGCGEGQYIDVSVMEAMAYFHEFAIVVWTHVGILNERAGNRHPVGIHPLSLYPCKDGHVSISVATPDQYDNLMLLIERPDLLDEPRYADRHDRWNLADEFDEILLPWLMEHTADDIVGRAQETQDSVRKAERLRPIDDRSSAFGPGLLDGGRASACRASDLSGGSVQDERDALSVESGAAAGGA